jgi:hypothetical protein
VSLHAGTRVGPYEIVSYDAVRKGERFLMIRLSADSGVVQSLRLIVNWARGLE